MTNQQRYSYRVAIIVALGGFLLGFDASVISGVLSYIDIKWSLSDLQLGWAVSAITIAAAVGMLISGPLSDKYGRRNVLKVAAILFTASAILTAIAPTFSTFIIGRLLGGFAVGAALIIAPMYIAEIAPPAMRGKMVSFNQLNIVLGISGAFFTNYLILQWSQSDTGWVQSLGIDAHAWRWMLGLEALPAIFYFFGLFIVPFSPRWLVMKGRNDEALDVMKRVTSVEEAEKQINQIEGSISEERNKEKVGIGELFKPAMRLVLLVGIVVGIFQMTTGINSVLFFAPMIFEQTGMGQNAAFVQAVIVGITNLVFTLIAMATIDRLGRKPLLVIGLSGCAVFMIIMAFGFYNATYTLTNTNIANLPEEISKEQISPLIGQTYTNDVTFKEAIEQALGAETAKTHESAFITNTADINSTLILIAILGFVSSFAVSIGPVMWVLFSELFPNRIRGLAITFVGLVNALASFTVQTVFPWEMSNFGSGTTFLIYGICSAVGLALVLWIVPETKGRSLEELEAELIK